MEHGPFKWVKPHSLKLPKINTGEPDLLNENESFEDYLKDTSCLSSTMMKHILKSPRHYLAELAGFDVDHDDEKDHFRIGRAVHMAVLEPKRFKELYVVMPDFGAMQSPKNRATRDQWKLEQPKDSLILKQEELDDLYYMIDALMEHPEASNLFKNGKPEVSGRFTHQETGVRIKIRPDYFTWQGNELFVSDIKTTKDASPGLFATDAARLKYYLQLALYHDGIYQITNTKPEAVALIAMEKKIPYTVALYWLDPKDLEMGTQWYLYALRTFKKCIDTNQWPGTQLHGQMLSLPQWVDTQQLPRFDWRE